MAIRLVTDSTSDLPAELAQRWHITVIPCYVVEGDVTYRDGVDLSHDQFYRRLTSGSSLPTTAQPSIADFRQVYEELLGQGHQIVSQHVSGKLSGTLNSAEQAKASLAEASPAEAVPIEIVDSRLASIPLGLTVVAAAEQSEQVESYQQVAENVRRDLPLTHAFFLLDTLEYLQKGGRIGRAQAFLGSMLSVKPILKLQDGEAHPVERPRTWDRGVRRMGELVRELAPVRQLAVTHSTDPDRAAHMREQLSDLLPPDQIISARFGPTLGTYLGPNALGVALTQTGRTDSPV